MTLAGCVRDTAPGLAIEVGDARAAGQRTPSARRSLERLAASVAASLVARAIDARMTRGADCGLRLAAVRRKIAELVARGLSRFEVTHP